MPNELIFERPNPAEYRSIRYSIHRNVHGLSIAEASAKADADLAAWLAEEEARRAADALDGAA